MKWPIILVVLVVGSLGEKEEETSSGSVRYVRAPQGHLQYSDPDGYKVSWKLYTPQPRWESSLENSQRTGRAESDTAQPRLVPLQSDLIRPAAASPRPIAAPAPQQEKSDKAEDQVQIQYKPYAMVPAHIKQLLAHMYQPPVPYVDPAVYIYPTVQQQRQQEEQDKHQRHPEPEQPQLINPEPRYEQFSKYYPKKYTQKTKLGYIQYKDEQPAASDSGPLYGAVPERHQYDEFRSRHQQPQEERQEERQNEDPGMPREIHQLLNLQAQTPYHVIANGIVYKPKTIFVPKPLSDDGKGPYKYRSKVYFMKDLEEEQQQNKQRSQRDEPKELEGVE